MFIDLTGRVFTRLTVIERAGTDAQRFSTWRCRCTCGNVIVTRGTNLTRHLSCSCGCLHHEELTLRQTKHNKTGTPIYHIWSEMVQRCSNPNNKGYQWYGARGISVCDRWLTFSNFYADMGDPPTGRTLDRRNNNGNYEPGNCRWATPKEQNQNMRRRSDALPEELIRQVKAAYIPGKMAGRRLARRFNVSRNTIDHILYRI